MKKIIVLSFLLFVNTSWADWSSVTCPDDVKIIADELIKLEMSGMFLTTKSRCLSQSNFKYVLAEHNPGTEEEIAYDHIISNQYKIEITQVKKEEFGVYEIFYKIIDAKKQYTDSFKMMVYRDSKLKKNIQCADIFAPSNKVYILKECL